MFVARILFFLGCLTIAQLGWRPVLSLTISDYLFFASFVIALISSVKSQFSYNLPKLFLIGIFIYSLGVLLTFPFINNQETEIWTAVILAKVIYLLLFWMWLGTQVLTTPRHIQIALLLFSISCLISAIFGLTESLPYPWSRPIGTAEHPNQFGATCALGLAIGYFSLIGKKVYPIKKSVLSAIISALILVFCTSGLLASKSIGSIFAIVAAFIYWIYTEKYRIKSVSIFSLTMTILIIGLLYAATVYHQTEYSLIERVMTQSNVNDPNTTLRIRIDTYVDAYNTILKNPIVGTGIGTPTITGYSVHNIFLKVLFESGLLSLIGIIIIIGSAFLLLYRTNKLPLPNNISGLPFVFFITFLIYFVITLKEPILYNRFGWFPFLLCLAFIRIISRNSYDKN